MSDDISIQRDRLLERLKRVPPKVNNGGVRLAREFKEFHKKTMAELQKRSLSKDKLLQLQFSIEEWYSGGEA